MTDLEKFQELYRSLGIELVVSKDGENKQVVNLVKGGHWNDGEATKSDKFDGYSGFYTDIIFDMDGKFIKQGFWE